MLFISNSIISKNIYGIVIITPFKKFYTLTLKTLQTYRHVGAGMGQIDPGPNMYIVHHNICIS